MKQKNLGILVMVAVAAAIFSFVVAGLIFRSPASRSSEVPSVPVISTDFPDVYNDPDYTFFLNKDALDPTRPVQIGKSKNKNPFNGGQ